MLEIVVRFDTYEVNFHRRELRRYGIRIKLQQKPFRILELLLRHPGDLVSRQELIRFLWPDSHVRFDRGLNTAVNSLRLALGDSSRETLFIETRPGFGYRFNAVVTEVSSQGADSISPLGQSKNRDAYENCLKGRYFLDKMTAEETHKGIAFFKSALAAETCCAVAYAGIADACCQLALLGVINYNSLALQARTAVALALRHDPDLPHSYVSAGRVNLVFDWDWQAAQHAVLHALSLDAGSIPARLLQVSLLLTSGRHDEALQRCREALLLDLLSVPARLQLATCLYAVRDYNGAVAQCWNLLTLAGQFAPAQLLLALAYQQLGLFEEAIVELTNAKHCVGFEAAAAGSLGNVLAILGRVNEAEVALHGSTQADGSYVSSHAQALLSAAKGENTQALLFLQDSLRKREPAMLLIAADARFDALREDESFQSVLFRLGIEIPGRLRSGNR